MWSLKFVAHTYTNMPSNHKQYAPNPQFREQMGLGVKKKALRGSDQVKPIPAFSAAETS